MEPRYKVKPSDPLSHVHQALRESSGPRPAYFDDPDIDRVLAITLAVAEEVGVIAERLDSMQRLLESRGLIDAGELDAFEPSDDVQDARLEWHRAFIARVLRVVDQSLEPRQSNQVRGSR